jgi:hypothetical protein
MAKHRHMQGLACEQRRAAWTLVVGVTLLVAFGL